MNYWLYKSEPGNWSWDDQMAAPKKTTEWDGVRNYQANNNMKAMKKGDRGFFYHSVKEKTIVGVVEVVKEHEPDPTDKTGKGFGMVTLKAVGPMPEPVNLAQIKEEPKLESMVLVNNSRLSVQPVTASEWKHICKMGKFKS
ncbi:EVE domain-containing protein [Algisphaera agarilytica]|uniref:Putative RNA-binding protein with PUA-like domain n=1 Tax=Algisphaera agarilytica TaxID=1385975 RepID=A0A7X0H982_9BACT|nr:EVE domain-containing protein [Algisphaera agarilytica]MBB6431561.1 putative RNA-binding protein with PUA-like domain [Algisphaera agarilytica]